MAWILTETDLADLKSANSTTVTDEVVNRLKTEVVGKPDFGSKTALQDAIKVALGKTPVVGGTATKRGDLATLVATHIESKQQQQSPQQQQQSPQPQQQSPQQQQQSPQPQQQSPQPQQQSPVATPLKLTQDDINAVKNAGKISPEDAGKLASVTSQTFQDEAALKTAIKTALEQGAPTGTNKDAEATALVTQVKTRATQAPAAPTSALPSTQPQNTATMFSASVDINYSRKWGFDMTASSKVTAKIVAVPAPQAFLDALEDARAGLSKRSS